MSAARCEEYQELVSAFVDEHLDGAELLRLEAHLADCSACRAFEVELRRFTQLLQAGEAFRPLRRPPPHFASLVAARAVAQPERRTILFPGPADKRRTYRHRWLGLAAAAAAAALFFAWSWQRLLPGDLSAQRLAVRPLAPQVFVTAAADEGNLESWMREHAMLARDRTLLGSAEEIEFASFRAAAQER